MIKHIVMWRLYEQAGGNSKAENVEKLCQMLLGLRNNIPEIKHLETGINVDTSKSASDVVLYCEFDNLQDLRAYQQHPLHQQVVDFLNKVRSEKRVVDYEV
ncbi:MAG: Dabb family protein [Calditrichia bacterium]